MEDQTTTDPSWGWTVNSDDETNAPQDHVFVVHDEEEPLLDQQVSFSPPSTMADALGASTGRLVSGRPPAHVPQYLTAIAATLGSLAMGAILGYTSPAGPQLTNGNWTDEDCNLAGDDPISDSEMSWVSSLLNIGALVGAPLGGVFINMIGRRGTMLISILPFILGWLLIGLATNFAMLVAGRMILGLCCGLVSLSVPTYLGEVASTDIRGLLGSGFQLMVTVGILYSYAVGSALCWQWLALACLVPACIFVVGMFFSKESPVFLLAKNRPEDARQALQFFRGKDYDIDSELSQLQQSVAEAQANKASFRDLKTPHIMRPFIISMSLMFFQQFSGVNAILFNLSTIFGQAGVSMSANASAIIIAAVQVGATALAAVLMDKAGRKLLLLVSSAAMCISLVTMGVFFYLKEQEKDVSALGWLPLTSLIVFIAFFSIGYGPVPWVMMGELFTADIKELAGSLATLTNWALSFIVTLIFTPLQDAINDSGVYWMFAGFCAVNFLFSLLVVKETKGKSIQEISAMFGAPASPDAAQAQQKRRSISSRSSASGSNKL